MQGDMDRTLRTCLRREYVWIRERPESADCRQIGLLARRVMFANMRVRALRRVCERPLMTKLDLRFLRRDRQFLTCSRRSSDLR
jgi:hypothetical protein